MATIAVWQKIDEERIVQTLQEAGKTLGSAGGDLFLDCSSMRRIDSSVLRVLEECVGIAEGKGVKVVLRGVNVDVYRVVKLVKLASRFSFVS